MRKPGYLQDIYSRDGEVLTIITSAAVDTEITAAISNTQNFQVCINSSGDDVDAANQADCKTDSGNTNVWHAAVCVNTADNEIDSTITVEATCDSTTDREWTENVCTSSGGDVLVAKTEGICFGWHTTSYYDHISENNSAAIKAKDGTGADLPALQSAQEDTSTIIVQWGPVGVLNTRLVTHYEVEWSADGATNWQQLADKVANPRYVDTGVEAGQTRYYRVRAVNDRSQKGAWSQPIKGTVAVPVAGNGLRRSAGCPRPHGKPSRRGRRPDPNRPGMGEARGERLSHHLLHPGGMADGSNGPWAEPTDPAPQLGVSDDVLEPYRPDRRHSQVLPDEGDQQPRRQRLVGGHRRHHQGAGAGWVGQSTCAPCRTATAPSTCPGMHPWTTAARPSSTTRCNGPPTGPAVGATRAAPRTRRPGPSRTPA